MNVVFLHEMATDIWTNLGATHELARQQNEGEILIKEISVAGIEQLVDQFIVEHPVDGCEYIIAEPCTTCGAKPGKPRTDNGLPCGDHCDECWKIMVAECRQQSW